MRKRIAAALALLAGSGGGLAALAAGGAGQAPAVAAGAAGIGTAQVREIGLQRAAAAGDSEPLVAVEADSGPEAATAMAAPQGASLGEPEGGVYVVDMRGHFTLGQAHVPRWAPAPTGTVMKVEVARDGSVLGVHLGDR